jgi:hypothetical protein
VRARVVDFRLVCVCGDEREKERERASQPSASRTTSDIGRPMEPETEAVTGT